MVVQDLTTEDTTPIITGTLSEPNADFVVTVNGVSYQLGTDAELTLDNDGAGPGWTLDLSSLAPALDPDVYTITAEAIDIANNSSGEQTGTLTVLTAATIIDLATNDAGSVMRGTVDPNDNLSVTVDGTTYTLADAALSIDGSGQWSLDLAQISLSPDVYTVTVSTDAGGTTGTLALFDPATEFDPALPFVDVRGPVAINDASPLISGSAQPNESLVITIDGEDYPVTADVTGQWSLGTLSADLADGSYDIVVVNSSGAVTELDNGLIVDVNGSFDPPARFADVTGPLATDSSAPVLTGTAQANETIEVTVDGSSYMVTADASGQWDLALSGLAAGSYDISITNSIGYITELDDGLVIDLDGTFDPAASFARVTPFVAPVDTDTPVISGQGPANTVLTVRIDGSDQVVTTDALGNWSLTRSPSLG